MALTEKLSAIGDAIRVQSGKTELLTLDQMPEEIINLQSLNFEVVGNPQPVSPKENTIWVNTDVPIGKWFFSATQPELSEGDVWFPVGTFSSAEFNALKKNGIQVYPTSTKQMVGGALSSVEAKIYQGGEWIDVWNGELYDSGNEYERVTGGWKLVRALRTTGIGDGTAKLTLGETYMEISTPNNFSGGIAHTISAIDLTPFSTLTFYGTTTQGESSDDTRLGVWSSINAGQNPKTNCAGYVNMGTVNGSLTLDITGLSGKYFVGLFLFNPAYTTANIKCNKLVLS